MTFAVIKTGGKQYRVAEGDTLLVEKLAPEAGAEKLVFSEVLLVDNGSKTKVGLPIVVGASVEAERLAEERAPKIVVIKYKPKVRYRVKHGHRQLHTRIKITKINSDF